MLGKNIIVAGGSIAGCAVSIFLRRLGANVIILERSSGRLADRGAGITLPMSVVDQCVALDLFDQNIPRLSIQGRSFLRKTDSAENDAEKFWDQSINIVSLNWLDVYRNLRKRLDSSCYHNHTTVTRIHKVGGTYEIETTKKTYQADFVIAADGIDSTVRTQLIPNAKEVYAGYVAWRGVFDDSELNFQHHAPYFVFPGGHILLYRIPAVDYQATGKTLLNWVMYEDRRDKPLDELLIDKLGRRHARSLAAGFLSDAQINYLHEFSRRTLPLAVADIICQTRHPFIQAIFDFQLPHYEKNPIIFVGDAAATLRPHTGSGVFKALTNAIEFFKFIQERKSNNLSMLSLAWQSTQKTVIAEEIQKAKNMGAALVTHSPNWSCMSQQSTDQWWAQVMQGKAWYATDGIEQHRQN